MRAVLFLGIVLASGCSDTIGTRDPRGDGGLRIDAAPTDGGPIAELDARAPGDDGGPIGIDAPPPEVDSGTACTPTRSSECAGERECGAIPDGCPGGIVDCGECSGGETWCAELPAPRWRGRVWPCVQSVQAASPEYFDATMPCGGESMLVLEPRAAEYVRDVAACVSGSGAIAIPDANAPGNEIRARGDDDDVADNYLIRTYGTGCTAGRYTSSCTPAMF